MPALSSLTKSSRYYKNSTRRPFSTISFVCSIRNHSCRTGPFHLLLSHSLDEGRPWADTPEYRVSIWERNMEPLISNSPILQAKMQPIDPKIKERFFEKYATFWTAPEREVVILLDDEEASSETPILTPPVSPVPVLPSPKKEKKHIKEKDLFPKKQKSTRDESPKLQAPVPMSKVRSIRPEKHQFLDELSQSQESLSQSSTKRESTHEGNLRNNSADNYSRESTVMNTERKSSGHHSTSHEKKERKLHQRLSSTKESNDGNEKKSSGSRTTRDLVTKEKTNTRFIDISNERQTLQEALHSLGSIREPEQRQENPPKLVHMVWSTSASLPFSTEAALAKSVEKLKQSSARFTAEPLRPKRKTELDSSKERPKKIHKTESSKPPLPDPITFYKCVIAPNKRSIATINGIGQVKMVRLNAREKPVTIEVKVPSDFPSGGGSLLFPLHSQYLLATVGGTITAASQTLVPKLKDTFTPVTIEQSPTAMLFDPWDAGILILGTQEGFLHFRRFEANECLLHHQIHNAKIVDLFAFGTEDKKEKVWVLSTSLNGKFCVNEVKYVDNTFSCELIHCHQFETNQNNILIRKPLIPNLNHSVVLVLSNSLILWSLVTLSVEQIWPLPNGWFLDATFVEDKLFCLFEESDVRSMLILSLSSRLTDITSQQLQDKVRTIVAGPDGCVLGCCDDGTVVDLFIN